MKNFGKLFLVLIAIVWSSVCFGQLVVSGELILGRVNSVGGDSGNYNPSAEFNDPGMPMGFSAESDDFEIVDGGLTYTTSDGNLVSVVSPAGNWQLDMKVNANASDTYGESGGAGLFFSVTGYGFYLDLASGPAFILYNSEEVYSEILDIQNGTPAYFRVTNIDGGLTFEYSLDGSSYTEIEPDENETVLPEVATSAGTLISLQGGCATGTFNFDYVRFTQL